MFSLRLKLLIPTLLTTALMIAGIVYIIWVENTLFQQDIQKEQEFRQLKLYNGFKELVIKIVELTQFIGQDWQIQDSLLTEDRDRLLDLLIPFHQGFGFDLINVYDGQGTLIMRTDQPHLFGKTDQFQPEIAKFLKNPPTKPQITLFEGNLVLVRWQIFQEKTHGINAAFAVGYYLNAQNLNHINNLCGQPFFT